MKERNSAGLTLIELMIAVAIVGILAAVMLPTFNQHKLKGNRAEGYAALNEIMQAQERWKVENQEYTTDISQLGYQNPQETQSGYYEIEADNCAGASIEICVLLRANAQGNQTNDDNGNGGDLTLNSRGEKVGWD